MSKKKTWLQTGGIAAIGIGIVLLTQTNNPINRALRDHDLESPASALSTTGKDHVAGWEDWLTDFNGIWSATDLIDLKVYFAPPGISITDTNPLIKRTLIAHIKGAAEEDGVVVLDMKVSDELNGNVNERVEEWTLRKIANSDNTEFRLQVSVPGSGSSRLSFVRNFLPNEEAALKTLITAQSPSRIEKQKTEPEPQSPSTPPAHKLMPESVATPIAPLPPTPSAPERKLSALETRFSDQFQRCVESADSDATTSECIRVEMEQQDAALNSTYKKLMSRLSPADKATLKSTEIAWIKAKDARCSYEGQQAGDGTMGKVVGARCLLDRTVERLIELESME